MYLLLLTACTRSSLPLCIERTSRFMNLSDYEMELASQRQIRLQDNADGRLIEIEVGAWIETRRAILDIQQQYGQSFEKFSPRILVYIHRPQATKKSSRRNMRTLLMSRNAVVRSSPGTPSSYLNRHPQPEIAYVPQHRVKCSINLEE